MVVSRRWVQHVTTSSVNEGPRGTLGQYKTPEQMAGVLLEHNKTVSTGSILKYMVFFMNRYGRHRMDPTWVKNIETAMEIIRRTER